MNMLSQSFQGGVFSDETALGRVGVTIEITSGGLEARTREGDAFRIRAEELELEVGGASGRMVFCRNANKSITIFSEAPGFLSALTQHPSNNVAGQAVAQDKALKHTKLKRAGWGCSLYRVHAVNAIATPLLNVLSLQQVAPPTHAARVSSLQPLELSPYDVVA